MKINELKKILEKNKLDLAFFYNLDSTKPNSNMFYFSSYCGLGALIVHKKQAPFLVAPKMEIPRAKQSSVKKVYSVEKKRFFESLSAVIKKNKIKCRKIAIDNSSFSLNHYRYFKKYFKGMKTKDISLDCLKLRSIKSDKEITILKKSCHYASKILQKTLKNLKDFKTESKVAAFLEYETKKLGLDTAFKPIVASGSNGSIPHYLGNEKLKRGFCVMDFGVKYKGYCSDITRTVYLGKINKKEKEIYNFLLDIQNNIINNIKINDKCSKIYNNCIKDMKSYSRYFTHGLGHGVGVNIHELPNLALNSKDKIMENMVFTIEPGIYIPKRFGIRIEDSVIMKKKGHILTKTPKDLLVI